MNKQLLIDALPPINHIIVKYSNKAEQYASLANAAERLGLDLRAKTHDQNAKAVLHTVLVWTTVRQVVAEKISRLSAESKVEVVE
jgi:hypothetical protein